MSDNKISGNLFDFKILSRLMVFCRPYMTTFYVLVILTLSLSILQPIRPYITQIIIDDYVSLGDYEGLKNMIILLLFLLIVNAVVMYFHTYLSGWLGQNIIRDIRIKLFSHLQKFKLQFFDKTPIGRIVTRNVSDIETIADIFGQGIAAIIGDILQLVGIVVLMFFFEISLTFLTHFYNLFFMLPQLSTLEKVNISQKIFKIFYF